MVVDTFTGGAMNIEKSVSSGFCCCFLQFGHGIYTRDNLLSWIEILLNLLENSQHE